MRTQSQAVLWGGDSSRQLLFRRLLREAKFANTCYHANSTRQVKRLLWLLPLALFAFVTPVVFICLVFSLWLNGFKGGS
ncbi:MAG TPA: hypothetical protein VMT15_08345 [Bryobacteraceae bacterium]|nr:hypothetical protein [Bryobacteraceae bacterium]